MSIRTLDNSDRRHRGEPYHLGRALSRFAGAAALTVAVLLLLGVVGFLISGPGLGVRNWLVVFFQLDSGRGSLPQDPLRLVNGLDIAILVLVALIFLGLWPGPGRPHKLWMAIAVALPIFGIPLLLLTHLTGRSGVLAGGIIVAILMVTNRGSTSLGTVGLLANGLLLIGDFATSGSRIVLVAAAVAIGYVLLVVWFVGIGVHLLLGYGFQVVAGGKRPSGHARHPDEHQTPRRQRT